MSPWTRQEVTIVTRVCRIFPTIVVARFPQIPFSPRWPVGQVERTSRRRRRELRSVGRVVKVMVTTALGVAAVTAIARTGEAVSEDVPKRYPVTILSSRDQATVSWQVRSSGAVRLRLYRSQPLGGEVLVDEVTTQQGVGSFEFVDRNRPPGNAVYVLRVADIDGSETTLGSILCVEQKFNPDQAVFESSMGSSPLWAPLITGLTRPSQVGWSLERVDVVTGWAPIPEPPVPRVSPAQSAA